MFGNVRTRSEYSLFEDGLKQFHGISEFFLEKLARSIADISFVSRGFVYYGTFESLHCTISISFIIFEFCFDLRDTDSSYLY